MPSSFPSASGTLPPSTEAPSPPWEGQAYSAKRHGVTITNCDAEPVQTPGCIQAHGALLVVRPDDLTIRQASENTARFLDLPPEGLIGRPLAAAIGDAAQARVRAFLDSEHVERNPLYAFTLDARAGAPALDVFLHTTDGVAVIELETARAGASPDLDYYEFAKRSIARLQLARSLRAFCQAMCVEVQALTGLDRVMVYRFHEDGHGEVFAERHAPHLAPWLGLHYPQEDIPRPAREVFKQIWIRPVPDISAELVELVPLANPDTGAPLTMTHCVLRGPSVMYTEYLQNMGVAAAFTMSIRRGDELWGLIAGHHYAGPLYFPAPLRAACELFAQIASLDHQAVEEREHLADRIRLDDVHQKLAMAAAREGVLPAILEGSPSLLNAIDAGGAALWHRETWTRVGRAPSDAELSALVEWLKDRSELTSSSHPLYATDALARSYPPAAAFADVASGLLAVRLSRTLTGSFLLWFRPETIQTVTWGGNPHDKPTVLGPHGPRLTPRRSFELFVESVAQRSAPWREFELDAARRFRILLMEVVVDQASRLAALNADLVRINDELDAFAYVASHDLKEPLRGIHNYAHQILEELVTVEEEQRRKLERVVRLTARMDGLIDALLLFSRMGRVTLRSEDVDLNAICAEALEIIDWRASEQPTDIVFPRPLPQVWCDPTGVREILVNLISNALKYNDKPRRSVEIGYLAPGEPGDRGAAPAAAASQNVYYVRDNGIGIPLRAWRHVFTIFKRLHGRDEYGGGTGVGLAIAKKLVERHGGTIWLSSIPGEGTSFFFTIPPDIGESK